MPGTPVLDLAPQAPAPMLAALRRARYGSLRALHSIQLRVAGRHPTDMVAVLSASRTTVYRLVRLQYAGA